MRAGLGLAPAAPIAKEAAAPATAPAAAAPAGGIDEALLEGVAAAVSVVKAHRTTATSPRTSTRSARSPRATRPCCRDVGLTPEIMARIPASLLRVKVPGDSFAAALPELRKAYCGTIAYEIEHLSDHGKRLWLRGVIESGRLHPDPLAGSPQGTRMLSA